MFRHFLIVAWLKVCLVKLASKSYIKRLVIFIMIKTMLELTV